MFNCIDQVDTQNAYKTLIANLSKAYPGYIVKCLFNLTNIGFVDGLINETVISDPSNSLVWDETKEALVDSNGDPIIYIDFVPGLVGTILTTTPPNNRKEFEMTIEITQNAKECFLYMFEVKISVEAII